MKIKLIALLITTLSINYIYGFMFIDMYQLSKDRMTFLDYTFRIGQYLERIGKAVNTAEQLKNLKSLQQIQGAGRAICELCTPLERQQLELYIQHVNDDLCSQFNYAMDNLIGFQGTIKSMQDVINNLTINPQAAGLALQQASIQASIASASTLSQIQLLIAQQEQKKLAEQKLERQVTDDIYSGFKNSGL